MKLIELSPNTWINVGTGAVSRVELFKDGVTPVLYLNDGGTYNLPQASLTSVIKTLQSQEQNYEKD